MISFRGISKCYGKTTALRGIDLNIISGQTTALIGPSGCGKSSLIRVLVGVIEADEGSVSVNGASVGFDNLIQLRRRMGYVIQDGGLFPHLSARDNVTLLARHLKWPRDRMDKRVTELSELVRLSLNALERYPLELSGGQKQRVGIMRALMLDPEVLLLDEPLGALDPMIRADLQSDLKSIFSELDKTVLLVTHDLAEAGYLADTVVLLNEGRIVQEGPLEELLHRPSDPFVTRFVQAQSRRFGSTGADE